MQVTFSHMLETRVWAAAFSAIPFVLITYLLFRLSGKKDGDARDRFWRTIAVVAELASALGVIAAIAVAAQYFVKGESESLQESVAQASAKRQGGAFVVGLTSCGPQTASGASVRELSALSQLCVISKAFSQPAAPPLDEAIVALKRLNPLPANVGIGLSPQVEELARLLQAEVEVSRQLHLHRLQARMRPGESDFVVVVIALGILFGATLKFSRSLSEWYHRRAKG